MDDCELIALVTAVACGIYKCASENELALLAVVFTQLGDTLATLITQKEIRENITKKISESNQGPGDGGTGDSGPGEGGPGLVGTNTEAPI